MSVSLALACCTGMATEELGFVGVLCFLAHGLVARQPTSGAEECLLTEVFKRRILIRIRKQGLARLRPRCPLEDA